MDKKYTKSLLSYTGNKFALLEQIEPLFIDSDIFADLFIGSLTVGINNNSRKIIANDSNIYLVDLFENLMKNSFEESYDQVVSVVNAFDINNNNKDGYYKLREYYNKEKKHWSLFYVLACYSFSRMIRFNKKGEFNAPFGRGVVDIENKKDVFESFVKELKKRDIEFYSKDFYDFDINLFNKNTLVYCDPPYLISQASYNTIWNKEKEKQLHCFLDNLDNKGINFALSNVITHNGIENSLLKDWMKKYNVHNLNKNYNNSFYNIKDKKSKTLEVLITNY